MLAFTALIALFVANEACKILLSKGYESVRSISDDTRAW